MSTRSYVAFADGQSTTGVYVHHDGTPASRLPVLAAIYHGTFGRDLARMRAALLEHTAGWLSLSPDSSLATSPTADNAHTLVPGVGVARVGNADMTATGDGVFDEEYSYIFDSDTKALTVYECGERILHLPEDRWAPIGPTPVVRRLLRIVAADPPGELCLTGQTTVYTEGDISRLMQALDIEPGDCLEIADGGDLFDFHHAATATGLLPGNTWFCTDGDGMDSDGGWISLPYDLPGVEITTRYFDASEYASLGSNSGAANNTRSAARDLLDAMQAAIALAVRSLNAWRGELPAFVLNIRHPDYETDTYIDGYEPEIHTVDLGADFDSHARDPEQALEFAATQLTYLYHWPHRLRRVAASRIERAVGVSERALVLTAALAQDTVSTEAIALAGSVLGVHVPGRPISKATRHAWDEARTGPTAPEPEPEAGSQDEGDGMVRTIVDHLNYLGDWCPWSNTNVTANYDDDRCPAACRSSWIDEDDTAKQAWRPAA